MPLLLLSLLAAALGACMRIGQPGKTPATPPPEETRATVAGLDITVRLLPGIPCSTSTTSR